MAAGPQTSYDLSMEDASKMTNVNRDPEPEHATDPGQLDVTLDSPALRRLLEEVRSEDVEVPRGYNRTFNRHNR